MKRRQLPIAVTIAGSDSGGGAGIQADLKTFAALGVHGTTAMTCVTAQNPRRISTVHPCPPSVVRAQIQAVFAELRPAAVKTGMLYSREIIQVVADCLRPTGRPPLVVDPVLRATSGAPLLNRLALRTLLEELLPLALLVTPNLDEAAVLSASCPIRTVEQMRHAARQIQARCGCAVLVKGGHLRGTREAIDIFYDGQQELLFSAPALRGLRTHGTGCTLSAAITAFLARGKSLTESIRLAKDYITHAIQGSQSVGRHSVLAWSEPPRN
jgi:hydroxymethylpyrimidine/phosphomethylpyrimidine kinase